MSFSVPTNPNAENLQQFLARVNVHAPQGNQVTEQELFAENNTAYPGSPLLRRQAWALLVDRLDGQVLVPDRVARTVLGGGRVIVGTRPSVDFDGNGGNAHVVNNGFEWLTYEAVMNQPRFRRTNQKLALGLYTVPMSTVIVFMRSRLSPAARKVLQEAFLPDLTPNGLEIMTKNYWPWKNEAYHQGGFIRPPETLPKATASGPLRSKIKNRAKRKTAKIYIGNDVVMPYNYLDNKSGSFAFGTKQPDSGKRLADKHRWEFWKTASRSNVVKLTAIKAQNTQWKKTDLHNPVWADWPFGEGDDMRQVAEHGEDGLPPQGYVANISGPNAFQLANLTANHYSVKTGVCYVGGQDQSMAKLGDAGKDQIDSNWIVACLRSDFVVEIVHAMAQRGVAVQNDAAEFLVLTEVLSIVEKAERSEQFENKTFGPSRDGCQVRDLSLLKTDRVYVFPGSIPFLALDHQTLCTEFAHAGDPAYRDFWRQHWAEGLGRTKALFLLRYGLQHLNPNPQNYLIELRNNGGNLGGPSRIVIRDLQDASFSRECVWALFGNAAINPPDGHDAQDTLAAAFRTRAEGERGPSLVKTCARILQYELENEEDYQETGHVPDSFGPAGTQLLWWRFSSFYTEFKQERIDTLEGEIGTVLKDQAMETLTDWAMAHAVAYVSAIEEQLGVELRAINWGPFPTRLVRDEEAVGAALHAFLRTDGQRYIREYHARDWAAPAPVATIRAWTDNQPLPRRVIRFTPPQGAPWMRVTRPDGTIPLYQAHVDTTQLALKGDGNNWSNITQVAHGAAAAGLEWDFNA